MLQDTNSAQVAPVKEGAGSFVSSSDCEGSWAREELLEQQVTRGLGAYRWV